MMTSPQKMLEAKAQKRAAHAHRGECQHPECSNEWTAYVVRTRRGWEAHCIPNHSESVKKV